MKIKQKLSTIKAKAKSFFTKPRLVIQSDMFVYPSDLRIYRIKRAGLILFLLIVNSYIWVTTLVYHVAPNVERAFAQETVTIAREGGEIRSSTDEHKAPSDTDTSVSSKEETGVKRDSTKSDGERTSQQSGQQAPPSPESIEAKILKAWEGTGEGHIAVAVARGESGLDPNARGWNCRYRGVSTSCRIEDRGNAWSVDAGLFQINSMGKVFPQELFDIDKNIEVARKMYETRGFSPWVAYKNGQYLNHI